MQSTVQFWTKKRDFAFRHTHNVDPHRNASFNCSKALDFLSICVGWACRCVASQCTGTVCMHIEGTWNVSYIPWLKYRLRPLPRVVVYKLWNVVLAGWMRPANQSNTANKATTRIPAHGCRSVGCFNFEQQASFWTVDWPAGLSCLLSTKLQLGHHCFLSNT